MSRPTSYARGRAAGHPRPVLARARPGAGRDFPASVVAHTARPAVAQAPLPGIDVLLSDSLHCAGAARGAHHQPHGVTRDAAATWTCCSPIRGALVAPTARARHPRQRGRCSTSAGARTADGAPVYSLYAPPSDPPSRCCGGGGDALRHQDIGARPYTYVWTGPSPWRRPRAAASLRGARPPQPGHGAGGGAADAVGDAAARAADHGATRCRCATG